jgi:pSer/pThr/pTyr-binding forkhead associated (FHA) protein
MSELIVQDGKGTQRVPVVHQMMVGRSPNGQLVLRSPYASRRHAWIWQRGEQVILEDLGSTHGTYVNGRLVTSPYLLKHNDVITIGDARLIFSAHTAQPLVGYQQRVTSPEYPITPSEPVVARPFPTTRVRDQRSPGRETWIVILLLAIMAVSLLITAGVLLVYVLG